VIAPEQAAFEHDVGDMNPVPQADIARVTGHGVPRNCTRPRAWFPLVWESPSSSMTCTNTPLRRSSRSQALARPNSMDPVVKLRRRRHGAGTHTGVWLAVAALTMASGSQSAVGRRMAGHGLSQTCENVLGSAPLFTVHVHGGASWHAVAMELTLVRT
jgi:hypothetical protein